jgi:hypothetical protein
LLCPTTRSRRTAAPLETCGVNPHTPLNFLCVTVRPFVATKYLRQSTASSPPTPSSSQSTFNTSSGRCGSCCIAGNVPEGPQWEYELKLDGYRQGLNPANRRALLKLLQPLATKKCPFASLPTVAGRQAHWGEGVTAAEMGDYVWLRPEIEAEIKFAEWTASGLLRHAEFVTVRKGL